MGSRGPVPAVRGGAGRAPVAGSDPKVIQRPAGMPDAANAIWDALARALAAAGRLEPEDGAALESLCRHLALRSRIFREIEEGGILTTLNDGKTSALNQHFKALHQVEAQVERGVRHFGLSPASRGALKADRPGTESDELDALLNAGD